MARVWFWLAAFTFLVPLNAKAGTEDWTGRETLNATLWMQRAPEYRAIAEQVYAQATERISAPRAGQCRTRTGRYPG